jgi:hypothetical protein
MGNYSGCMEGEDYNFNQSTTTCMDNLLAMQKVIVEKFDVQMPQEKNHMQLCPCI